MNTPQDHPSTWRSITRTGQDQARSGQKAPCLTILSHPHFERIGERAFLWSTAKGGGDALSRINLDFSQPGATFGKPLEDPYLSRQPLLFQAGRQNAIGLNIPEHAKVAVNGVRVHGGMDLSVEGIEQGVTLSLENRVCLLLHQAEAGSVPSENSLGLVGESDVLEKVRHAILAVAELEVPVLIRGETGTGKELVAQALHRAGSRSAHPFVSVSLAALPQSLAVSELFGAEKGAYTGASCERKGYFRAAHRGVLFLDEIGEASPEVQTLLLRALETSEVMPVGRHSPISVDIRLIAATDASLEAMMKDKAFKSPLFHRLAGYEIFLPSLRARREDIGRLLKHFVLQEHKKPGMAVPLAFNDPRAPAWIPADLCAALALYSWPGNIRQFRNTVRRLLIDNRHCSTLQADAALLERLQAPKAALQVAATPSRKPGTVSEEELKTALRNNLWEVKGTADDLGVVRSSLYDLLKKFGIPSAFDLDEALIVSSHKQCRGDLDAMVLGLEVSKESLRRRLKSLPLD